MRLLSIIALGASFFAAASAANAQTPWPNWYVGLHGSLAFVDDSDVDSNTPGIPDTEVEFDDGWGAGAALGYRPRVNAGPWNQFRIEAEFHYQHSDVDQINGPAGTFNGGGDVDVDAYMGNLYYDFATDWGIKPYIGGGAGWANVDFGSDDDNVFAYQGMAGIGYAPQSLPFTEWTLGYRYFATDDIELGSGAVDTEYDSHNIEIGAKFLF